MPGHEGVNEVLVLFCHKFRLCILHKKVRMVPYGFLLKIHKYKRGCPVNDRHQEPAAPKNYITLGDAGVMMSVLLSRNHEYLCRTTVVASVAKQSKLGLLRRFAPQRFYVDN
ncbi:MAG: hypothetical protein FWC73_07740, partial [Defluviitaleaceae bacterium]|nr:hypothetical protein [Defluviitaleaceae bacterium]